MKYGPKIPVNVSLDTARLSEVEVSSVESTSEEEEKTGDSHVYRVMPQSFEVPVFTHINPHLNARTLLCSVTKE